MTTQTLSAEIVSIVQHSPDSSMNLAQVVANKIEDEIKKREAVYTHLVWNGKEHVPAESLVAQLRVELMEAAKLIGEFVEENEKQSAEIKRLEQIISGKVETPKTESWPRWFKYIAGNSNLWVFESDLDKGIYHFSGTQEFKPHSEPSEYSYADCLNPTYRMVQITAEQAAAILEGKRL